MTKSFLNSFAQLSQSSERLSKSVEQLPQQMGEQLTKFVEEIDANQANIQKTLGQAEKTTLAVNDALERLDKVVASLNSAAKDVTETAAAWENAAKATGEVAREFSKTEESPKEGPSFNIAEYRGAAEQTSQAANDIKELLAAVDEFSKSRNYTSVINALTLRAIGLVLLIFALAVVYRIIASRLARARGDRAA